jgi:transcription elongation factor Elf1
MLLCKWNCKHLYKEIACLLCNDENETDTFSLRLLSLQKNTQTYIIYCKDCEQIKRF